MKKYHFFNIEYSNFDIQIAINDLDNNKYSDWSTEQTGTKYNIKSPKGNLYAPKRIFECLAKNKNLKVSASDFGSTEHLRKRLLDAGFKVEENEPTQQIKFRTWLTLKRKISSSTLTSYTEDILDKLKDIINRSSNINIKQLNPNMYFYKTVSEFDKFTKLLKSDPNFDIVNKTGQAQSGWVSTPLNHYRKFLEDTQDNNFGINNYTIEMLREELIVYSQQKGLSIKETAAYTALKKDKNIAEIHHIQANKFRVMTQYDTLPESLKMHLKRIPDSYLWSLNGEIYVDSREKLDILINIINFILKDSSFKKVGDIMQTNIPLNQILYGPPGTGKTFSVRKYIDEILGKNPGLNIENEDQRINNVVKDSNWYSAIALSMYQNGKNNKYKVAELLEQKIIKAFSLTRENKNVRAALWAQMQIHTHENCPNVNYSNRLAPFIFEKNENSEWYLTEDGIKFVEENLSEQLEQLSAKNNTRKLEDFYKFLTFHQSYSYEEFVEGIKPQIRTDEECSSVSYEYNKGVFKEICQQANSDPDNNYLLIIDEINRGNISKIFGELITLIEIDKRVIPNGERIFENTVTKDEQLLVTLPYTKSKFGVPNNLYILGTMNTSDRSIASIDIALRRRFKFVEMMPNSNLVADFGCNFKEIFEKLNNKIKILLDRDHQIGHSYFINTKYANADVNILKEIWFSEIIPLLNEYFYCDWGKLKLIIPGFIKEIEIPDYLKNECDEIICEFKTSDEVEDFLVALNQEKFE